MATDKENLKLLLTFIEQIMNKDGNEWFYDELSILISKKIISEKDTGIKISAVTFKELGSIDKYLDSGLIPIIDYSDILEEKTRFQLERDAIEMGKCRISKYSEKISFTSFCKYAHFQSEELINYYYHQFSNGNLDNAKNRIKLFNDRFTDEWGLEKKPYVSLSSIPFKIKQFAISKDLDLVSRYGFALSKIADVRNAEIHKDSSNEVEQSLKSFISQEDFNLVYESIIHLKSKILISLTR